MAMTRDELKAEISKYILKDGSGKIYAYEGELGIVFVRYTDEVGTEQVAIDTWNGVVAEVVSELAPPKKPGFRTGIASSDSDNDAD